MLIPLSKLKVLEIDGERVNPISRTRNTKNLQASMKKAGLIHPIMVREEGNGEYTILSGERRVTAARALGWKEIEAQTFKTAMQPLFVMAAANIEEPLSPLEQARHARLMRVYEQTSDHIIATAFGISVSKVNDLFALLSASPEVQKLVDTGKMSWSAFRKIARESLERQEDIVEKAQEKAKGDHVTVAAVKKAKQVIHDEENGEPMCGDTLSVSEKLNKAATILDEVATMNLSSDERAVVSFRLPALQAAMLGLQAQLS